jgi:hypothetical protein
MHCPWALPTMPPSRSMQAAPPLQLRPFRLNSCPRSRRYAAARPQLRSRRLQPDRRCQRADILPGELKSWRSVPPPAVPTRWRRYCPAFLKTSRCLSCSVFTRLLADRLGAHSEISVREGIAGAVVSPGNAWIAPGDFHMVLKRAAMGSRLELNQDPPENSCRPAVDVLFRSVADVYGAAVLAVVMTGMGSDGAKGARQIRDRGGEVIIQDEASSVVWGMPGLVYAAGQADGIYPLNQLGQEITRRVLESRSPRPIPTQNLCLTLEPRAK